MPAPFPGTRAQLWPQMPQASPGAHPAARESPPCPSTPPGGDRGEVWAGVGTLLTGWETLLDRPCPWVWASGSRLGNAEGQETTGGLGPGRKPGLRQAGGSASLTQLTGWGSERDHSQVWAQSRALYTDQRETGEGVEPVAR